MKIYLRQDERFPTLEGNVRDESRPSFWNPSDNVPPDRELVWHDISDEIIERWLASVKEFDAAEEAMFSAMELAPMGGWAYGMSDMARSGGPSADPPQGGKDD